MPICRIASLNINMRPLCTVCRVNLRAVAYHKYGRIYYRSKCNNCIKRGKKIKTATPRWFLAGYKKKATCDRCGFKSKHHTQLLVYHIDGNQNNCDNLNLKTLCLNCTAEINRLELPWRPGDISPDF